MNFEDLEKLTLETLITRHRDRFDLRYSTVRDLEKVLCAASDLEVGRAAKDTLTDWVLVTFEDRQQNTSKVILTGVDENGYTGTSPVLQFNREEGCVTTQNGSLYLLEGPAGEVPTDISRVMFVAGLFNSWGVGPVLGMPDVFL